MIHSIEQSNAKQISISLDDEGIAWPSSHFLTA